MPPPPSDEAPLFAAEEETIIAPRPLQPWRILVVDDDADVHKATVYALGNTTVLDRPLEFLHAYSVNEARAVLAHETDIAVILLDVVMDNGAAGLSLIDHVRNDLGRRDTRIVLRTGQPGYAPELEAIRDYDINDYKTKSELTRIKLFTSITTAVRSYQQLHHMQRAREGLEIIVAAAGELMVEQDIAGFARCTLRHLWQLLPDASDGLVASRSGINEGFEVLAGRGRFADLSGQILGDDPAIAKLLATLRHNHAIIEANSVSFGCADHAQREIAVLIETPSEPTLEVALLDAFAANMAVSLDNITLFGKLHSSAYQDALLRLPNRNHFVSLLDERIKLGQRDEQAVALLDIDHFSELNDAFGHFFGDMLLKAVAQRLRQQLSPNCVVARVAGDSFGVLGPEREVEPHLLLQLFNAPFLVEGSDLIATATVGLVPLNEVDGYGAEALKDASIALKRAKSANRGHFEIYRREMGIEIRDRVRLLQDLRSAFDRQQLFLVYQPQIDLQNARVVGAEALLRWRNDAGQLIPPDRFIPLAENSGLIIPLGDWVLRAACQEQLRWVEAGFRDLRVAVNVSVAQFRHPKFLAMLDQVLAETGMNPTYLELEITESVAMGEAQYMVELLRQIAERGIAVAIDDFGTGFSSLNYLQQLEVQRLKIDRSFVRQILDETSGGRSIAAMVIQLDRNLGLQVLAEGVEESAQSACLHELGCHLAQGFLFAKPMEPAALLEWLIERGG